MRIRVSVGHECFIMGDRLMKDQCSNAVRLTLMRLLCLAGSRRARIIHIVK